MMHAIREEVVMRPIGVLCFAVVTGVGIGNGHADDPARPAHGPEAPALPDPGPLDSVVAQATRDGKPLVVEFYTGWCAPCKLFDAAVLPDPKVQAELANVRFVRYDAERGSGIAAAEKLRISSYPTFLAIDDKGAVRAQTSGADPTETAWFIEFLQRGGVAVQSEDRVLSARKRAPGDARLAAATGRWYVDHERPADALAHFDAAVAADRNNALGVAAEAAWEAAGIRRAVETRARVTKQLLAYVRSYPGAQHAAEALTVATVGARLPAAERRALWQRVADAHKANATQLNEIVYDALAADELDAALAAAKRQVELTRDSANGYDTLAEVHHARREKAEALAREDQALALVKGDGPEKVTMQANRARFAADAFVPGEGVIGIQRRVAGLWKQFGALELPDGSSDRLAAIMASMNAARAVRNALLSDVGKQCAAQAGALTEAYARIGLDGKEPAITVLEPDASPALKQCLVDRLRKATYPRPGPGQPARTVERIPFKVSAMPSMH
jgi:thiol-disulfide isomerase/thioredoxin